jgi:hypothetical protein
MIGATKAIKTLVVAATIVSSLTLPAYADPFSKRPGSGGYSGPPVENRPKVDEKAYKSALERIPEPDKKYDPRGIARPPEPAKTTKKSNWGQALANGEGLAQAREAGLADTIASKTAMPQSSPEPARGICGLPRDAAHGSC